MKSKNTSLSALVATAALGGLLLAPAVHAATAEYDVSVSTSALVGNPSGPFSLDFQFNDGAGTGDNNNTASVSGFVFNGGLATGSPTLSGGATGSLATGLHFSDSSALNEGYQGFTPGSTLTFHVSLTLNVAPGSAPDLFSFGVLDSSLANLPTTGFGDSLFTVEIGASGATFATGTSSSPSVSVNVTAVPEPGVWATATGVLLIGFGVWRRRR